MKLSIFLTVLLPSVSGFVAPGAISPLGAASRRTAAEPLRAAAKNEPFSLAKLWRDVVGTASETKAQVDSTAADVITELRKKVLARQERQMVENQLCSLLRIGGNNISGKAEEHVQRLAAELEDLQAQPFVEPSVFGKDATLAGSWKLIYSSAGPVKGKGGGKGSTKGDQQGSVEDISYVSDHYRISHTDTGILRVYQRVATPPPCAREDDTANAVGKAGVGKRGAASAIRTPVRKHPIRKRMFFGWRRR